jgi:hypothetical protein
MAEFASDLRGRLLCRDDRAAFSFPTAAACKARSFGTPPPIDDAARYVDLDRLCLSPQCGFSSGGGGGQTVALDDERRKLELVLDVVQDVWK